MSGSKRSADGVQIGTHQYSHQTRQYTELAQYGQGTAAKGTRDRQYRRCPRATVSRVSFMTKIRLVVTTLVRTSSRSDHHRVLGVLLGGLHRVLGFMVMTLMRTASILHPIVSQRTLLRSVVFPASLRPAPAPVPGPPGPLPLPLPSECGGRPQMSGFERRLFVAPPDDKFSCAICTGVLRKPVQCTNGHVFCDVCIGDWLKKKPECPTCRSPRHPASSY